MCSEVADLQGPLWLALGAEAAAVEGWGVILETVTIESMQKGNSEARRLRWRGISGLLLLLSAVAYGLGLVHLRADFPSSSGWMGWSALGGEGWYAGAAIHHFVQGRWYLPEVLNSAVAMPVWPLLLGLWFKLTGVSMLWARALTMVFYGLSLVLLYSLMWRARPGRLAALAVLLTAIDPFCYAFNRLAILEPVTVFWFLLALWVAGNTQPGEWLKQLLLGVVLSLLVLTRITGVVLVPAVLFMMGASWGRLREEAAEQQEVRGGSFDGRDWRRGLGALVLSLGVALALWEGYVRLLVMPRAMLDSTLLWSMAARHAASVSVPAMAWVLLRDGLWISPVLFPMALLMLLLSLVWLRELWSMPLFGAAVLAVAGQMAFLGYRGEIHARYFEPIAIPVMMVVVLGLGAVRDRYRLSEKRSRERKRMRRIFAAMLLVVIAGLGVMTVETLEYVSHLEYSYWEAAQGIAAIVAADGGSRPVVLSDSGDDLTLWTGVSTVPESRITHGLDAVLASYQPGWLAVWQGREDSAVSQVGMRYRMDPVARYRVFDYPAKQTLVLYKLTQR
ncbi:MAG: glycosyltransferase family 39 protein [Acidobacteriaceae bacterium]